MMPRRALLILNGNSRGGKAAQSKVIEGLRILGIDPVHKECSSREKLAALIADEGANAEIIIVGGGDGTLNSAAAGVVKVKRPLGIIPLGTANDLARTLGIPSDVDFGLTSDRGRKNSIDRCWAGQRPDVLQCRKRWSQCRTRSCANN